MSRRTAALAIALLATAGCSTTATDPRDPLEGFNRAMYAFNDGLDEAVLKPKRAQSVTASSGLPCSRLFRPLKTSSMLEKKLRTMPRSGSGATAL